VSLFRLFVISSFILVTSAFALDPAVVVERALSLKKEVELNNQSDLQTLHKDVQAQLAKLNDADLVFLEGKIKARLAADKKTFREIRAVLLEKKIGTYELKTSLVKLIGVEDAAGMVVHTGILDDAAKLLDEGALEKTLEEINPKRNTITVLKTLYLYTLVEGAAQIADLEPKVKLLYSTPFPAELEEKVFGKAALTCSKHLLIPNAGYIYGGNFVEGKCRGIDCSAFVSQCSESRVRMSTMYLDILWRDMQPQPTYTDQEKEVVKEFVAEWKLEESKKDFQAIAPELELLQPGDLVTWRAEKGAGGHTAIFLSAQSDGTFLAVEANRADDKTKEGIEVNPFPLKKEGSRTTVLRRR